VTALLRPAAEADLNQIVQIERESFADPWTEESFRRLLGGHPAIFRVIGNPPDFRIAGYVIAFAVGEDAELLNVAVEPTFRNYYRRPVEDALVMRRTLEVAEGGEERSAGSFADR